MQRTTTVFLTALAALAAAAPAQGATRLIIRGAGFGHGVGMSQYGAYGYAQHGKDYKFILRHYYTGTTLSRLDANPTVRVLLQTGSTSFRGASRASGRKLSTKTTYYVAPTGIGRVALRTSTGRTLKTFTSPLRVTGPGPLVLDGAAQNGTSRRQLPRGRWSSSPRPWASRPSTRWASRTTSAASSAPRARPRGRPRRSGRRRSPRAPTRSPPAAAPNYDQFADTRSQMYVGVRGEVASTESAVSSTAGQVVTYGGKPVVTYFFSTSGGRTEDVENSFIGSPPKPWLRSVSDPYDGTSPRHRWGPYRMSLGTAASKLGASVKGRFRGIDVTRRGESPRVVYADVVGSRGRTRVTGAQLRQAFGLFDTWATFNVIGSKGTTHAPKPATTTPSDPAGSDSGGVSPGGEARAAFIGRTGAISGRVGWVRRATDVVLQWRSRGRWVTVGHDRTDARGHYRVSGLRPGAYRVRWRGVAGPVVALGA